MSNTTRVRDLLGLRKPPIAIGFLDTPPADIVPWSGPAVPAGCAFWAKAQQGESFYTVQADHLNCAVGAYTHSIPLPTAREPELMDTIGFMVQTKYLAMEEVPGIPTLPKTPQVVAYALADTATFTPDLILVAAQPAQAMLLYEAAVKAGASAALSNALGRPACAVLPLAVRSGSASLSLGCIGNRTFTGLGADEMYVCVPADKWAAVADKLVEAFEANKVMGAYYQGKEAQYTA